MLNITINNNITLQDKLDYITKKANDIRTIGGAIELNPNDIEHINWYNENNNKGE
jgi:hypothetical protein